MSSDTIIGQGATLIFKLVKMKLFRASQRSVVHIEAVLTSNKSPACHGTTSEDFSEVYSIQWSASAVCYSLSDISPPLVKRSYKSSSLLRYFDCLLLKHTVECCNINSSCLSQIRREKFCFARNVCMILLYFFCVTAVVLSLMPRLANFSPCDPLVFCFSPTLYTQSLLKNELFSNVHG